MSLRAATLLALLALALPSAAGAATPRTSLPDVEDEVMCVVCGTPLNLAQAPQADRERAFIQGLIDQGRSKDEIKARLEAEYGSSVLALPADKGFGAAVYVVPIAVVALALAGMAIGVPRWRRRRDAAPAASDESTPPGPEPTSEETRRLDEELARFEG
jgi:cytochrome c-type biogenesis protein CcmH